MLYSFPTRKYRVVYALNPFSAYDIAQSKQHKSISASDVLKALETIELGDMVNKLQAELLSASSTPNPILLHSTVEHNLFFLR